MSKELKCPFCQQELVEIQFGEQRYWSCINDRCNESVGFGGNLKIWKELIRTHKALDVAKYAIKNIQEDMKERKDGDDIWEIQKNLHDYCKTTLKQIKALEQKE